LNLQIGDWRLRARVDLLVAAILLSTPVTALAQSWPERVHISVNGAFQSSTTDFSDRFEFEKDLETGSTGVDYRVGSGALFDGGAGFRVWKNLGVGVAISIFDRTDNANTTTRSPHPFFFERPREVTGEATGLSRSETAVHVQAMYLLRASGPLRIVISGGPSFFSVKQDLVSEVVLDEDFPFDTAGFGSVQKQTSKGTAPSFNVGADVIWMFTRGFGVGGVVRFARTTVDLDAPRDRTVSVDAGGVYTGAGIRLLF
jgi:hypothetical protein